jgi:hypothetical protein
MPNAFLVSSPSLAIPENFGWIPAFALGFGICVSDACIQHAIGTSWPESIHQLEDHRVKQGPLMMIFDHVRLFSPCRTAQPETSSKEHLID